MVISVATVQNYSVLSSLIILCSTPPHSSQRSCLRQSLAGVGLSEPEWALS